MPSTIKSPYATSFQTAVKRGTPAGITVAAIAKRQNTTQNVIFNSLYKAGLCLRQKFNGQWVYWPSEDVDIKTSATNAKQAQLQMWQSFIDWCIASGHAKPQLLCDNSGSQQEFMSYCRKYFNRQLNGSASSSPSRKRTTSQ